MGEINTAEVEALCAALDCFGPEPLTLQQVHALLFITAHPGVSLQELAEHLGVTGRSDAGAPPPARSGRRHRSGAAAQLATSDCGGPYRTLQGVMSTQSEFDSIVMPSAVILSMYFCHSASFASFSCAAARLARLEYSMTTATVPVFGPARLACR